MTVDLQNARVFVVVAAFNEAAAIRGVVDQLLATYPHVVVVDDGSTDGTADRLSGTSAAVLRHVMNRGQGAALQTGIRFALDRDAAVVVTFDADGQHEVGDIRALVAPVLAGEYDVTLGSRFLGRSPRIPWTRKLALKAGVLFTRVVSPVRITDVHNGLRAFSRRAAEQLRIRMDGMAHASEVFDEIREHGWSYCEVPVTIRYTDYSLAKGQSTWHAIRIAFRVLIQKFR